MSIVYQDVQADQQIGKYQLRVILLREREGGYSAIARDLPGVASQGDTIEDAIKNIREAFQGAYECYREQGDTLPWKPDHMVPPADSEERWILVDG